MKLSAQLLQHNNFADNASQKGVDPNSPPPRFDKHLEEFYSICDQIELHLVSVANQHNTILGRSAHIKYIYNYHSFHVFVFTENFHTMHAAERLGPALPPRVRFADAHRTDAGHRKRSNFLSAVLANGAIADCLRQGHPRHAHLCGPEHFAQRMIIDQLNRPKCSLFVF